MHIFLKDNSKVNFKPDFRFISLPNDLSPGFALKDFKRSVLFFTLLCGKGDKTAFQLVCGGKVIFCLLRREEAGKPLPLKGGKAVNLTNLFFSVLA